MAIRDCEKLFEDMFGRFDSYRRVTDRRADRQTSCDRIVTACDRQTGGQTDRQTSCDRIVTACDRQTGGQTDRRTSRRNNYRYALLNFDKTL